MNSALDVGSVKDPWAELAIDKLARFMFEQGSDKMLKAMLALFLSQKDDNLWVS